MKEDDKKKQEGSQASCGPGGGETEGVTNRVTYVFFRCFLLLLESCRHGTILQGLPSCSRLTVGAAYIHVASASATLNPASRPDYGVTK
jgi:hypothetical protein